MAISECDVEVAINLPFLFPASALSMSKVLLCAPTSARTMMNSSFSVKGRRKVVRISIVTARQVVHAAEDSFVGVHCRRIIDVLIPPNPKLLFMTTLGRELRSACPGDLNRNSDAASGAEYELVGM